LRHGGRRQAQAACLQSGSRSALNPASEEQPLWQLYQPPYPLTAVAQVRLVIEAMRFGSFISLFQASQQASTMAS